jgi:hypothetical protein
MCFDILNRIIGRRPLPSEVERPLDALWANLYYAIENNDSRAVKHSVEQIISQAKPEEIKKLLETPIRDRTLVPLAISKRQKAEQIMRSMDALQAASESNHSDLI